MDLEIAGKVALVTGAGGGLGGAIAASLAREGVRVALADIDEEALARNAAVIREAGGEALPLRWDLADLESADTHLASIRKQFGEVDILVNNSGGPPPTSALGVPASVWEAQFHGMVVSLLNLSDRIVPGMRARKWGRVITSTSSGVVAPIPNLAISNSLRLALVGWSKTLASEVAADGVTVNVVLPGRIATRRIEQLDQARAKREGRSIEQVVQASTDSIPANRYGRVEEYGNVVAFLASGAASYITGSVIRVDGGFIPTI
jgi:3-oxoacyl-[acyl-carrier protein] reductase